MSSVSRDSVQQSEDHLGQMTVQSKISDVTVIVLHERLDKWFLVHSIQVHPPFLAIMLENYHAFFFSQGLGQGYHLSRIKICSTDRDAHDCL